MLLITIGFYCPNEQNTLNTARSFIILQDVTESRRGTSIVLLPQYVAGMIQLIGNIRQDLGWYYGEFSIQDTA